MNILEIYHGGFDEQKEQKLIANRLLTAQNSFTAFCWQNERQNHAGQKTVLQESFQTKCATKSLPFSRKWTVGELPMEGRHLGETTILNSTERKLQITRSEY